MLTKRKIKVGVLRGEAGAPVGLPENFSGHDVFLSKNKDWHFEGKLSHPEKIFRSVDVIFNALRGEYGEDGKVQQLLEKFGVPYTGSGIIASAFGMNKALAREVFAKAGLMVPKGIVAERADEIFKTMGPSWVVKPISSGSSMGVSIAHNFNELVEAVKIASAFGPKILAEEHIKGREATCGVIENFRGRNYYSLPVLESFDLKTKKEIEEKAIIAHRALGCRHYSEADFIVSPKSSAKGGQVYILEVNTLPALAEESYLPRAVKAVGSSHPEFFEHIINLALSGR